MSLSVVLPHRPSAAARPCARWLLEHRGGGLPGVSLDPIQAGRYPFAMAEDQNDILAVNTDVAEAAQAPTIVDADDFDRETLDRRWRQFCLDADRYVAESTRPLVQASQHASL